MSDDVWAGAELDAEMDRRRAAYAASANARWSCLQQPVEITLNPDEFIDRLIAEFDAVETTPLGGLFP